MPDHGTEREIRFPSALVAGLFFVLIAAGALVAAESSAILGAVLLSSTVPLAGAAALAGLLAPVRVSRVHHVVETAAPHPLAGLRQVLLRDVARAERHGQALTVAVLRPTAPSAGHTLAIALPRILRAADYSAASADGSYVIVLPHCTETQAEAFALRVRTAVQNRLAVATAAPVAISFVEYNRTAHRSANDLFRAVSAQLSPLSGHQPAPPVPVPAHILRPAATDSRAARVPVRAEDPTCPRRPARADAHTLRSQLLGKAYRPAAHSARAR